MSVYMLTIEICKLHNLPSCRFANLTPATTKSNPSRPANRLTRLIWSDDDPGVLNFFGSAETDDDACE